MILSTDFVEDPYRVALYASAVLAADKGIPSEVVRIDDNTYHVVTEAGKIFRFLRKR
jgi:hypothetical protein